VTEIKQRVVLYHGGCRDGYGAAWAAHCYFGETADYIPVSHYKPLPKFVENSEIWFVDFCPRAQALVEILDAGHSVYILDHHLTTRDVIDTVQSKNLSIVFDIEHSGAVIAWKHFFPKRKVPTLLLLIEDRDLWRWNLADTEAVTEALIAMEWTFKLWDRLHKYSSELAELAKAGHLMVCFKKKQVASIIKRAYIDSVGGYKVPVVNSDSFLSNVGSALCGAYPEHPFAACWFRLGDGREKWSLRSIGEFNVADVAKLYGGGGHKNAAGFVK